MTEELIESEVEAHLRALERHYSVSANAAFIALRDLARALVDVKGLSNEQAWTLVKTEYPRLWERAQMKGEVSIMTTRREVNEEIDRRVRQYISERNLDVVKDYARALDAVLAADADLKAAYASS